MTSSYTFTSVAPFTGAVAAPAKAPKTAKSHVADFQQQVGWKKATGQAYLKKGEMQPAENTSQGWVSTKYYNVSKNTTPSGDYGAIKRGVETGGLWYLRGLRIAGYPLDIQTILTSNDPVVRGAAVDGNAVFRLDSSSGLPDVASTNAWGIIHRGNIAAYKESLGGAQTARAPRAAAPRASIARLASFLRPSEVSRLTQAKASVTSLNDVLVAKIQSAWSTQAPESYVSMSRHTMKMANAQKGKWHSNVLRLYADDASTLQQFIQLIYSNPQLSGMAQSMGSADTTPPTGKAKTAKTKANLVAAAQSKAVDASVRAASPRRVTVGASVAPGRSGVSQTPMRPTPGATFTIAPQTALRSQPLVGLAPLTGAGR